MRTASVVGFLTGLVASVAIGAAAGLTIVYVWTITPGSRPLFVFATIGIFQAWRWTIGALSAATGAAINALERRP